LRSGGTLGARGWGVLDYRPDMALGWARGCHKLLCEARGHLGQGVGVYWTADLTWH